MTNPMVTYLLISHRHGEDVTVHWTHEHAENAVYEYVVQWWSVDDCTVPADPREAVEKYFAEAGDEWYRIDTVCLQGERPAETEDPQCVAQPVIELGREMQ